MENYIRKTSIGVAEVYEICFNEIRAWINVEDGFNLCSLEYKKLEIIKFQQERFLSGSMYGTPILFPTPNRTKGNEFEFEGKIYKAVMHGVTRKQKFQIDSITLTEKKAEILAFFHMDRGNLMFGHFPFSCRLDLRLTVEEKLITYCFSVRNLDKRNMPYGFALHPFFCRNPQATWITVNADSVMERDDAMLPSGALISVKETNYDLNIARNISELELDDVFTHFSVTPQARIDTENLSLDISMSDVFSHLVVYAPSGADFFCIEPQTCSTDAINLYTEGHIINSGLQILRPGELESGEVRFILYDNRI